MDNRSIGTKYEEIARAYLIENGAKVLDINFHFHKMGEIDIIYIDSVVEGTKRISYLCFGEVKYRKNNYSGFAVEAVDYNKRKKITNVAMGYLKVKGISLDTPMRFDVIAIDGNHIEWYKNAFYPV